MSGPYKPGDLVIVPRCRGTQVARLVHRHRTKDRPTCRVWRAHIFRVASKSWTRHALNIYQSEILGTFQEKANAAQRRALPRAWQVTP